MCHLNSDLDMFLFSSSFSLAIFLLYSTVADTTNIGDDGFWSPDSHLLPDSMLMATCSSLHLIFRLNHNPYKRTAYWKICQVRRLYYVLQKNFFYSKRLKTRSILTLITALSIFCIILHNNITRSRLFRTLNFIHIFLFHLYWLYNTTY